MNLLAHAFLSFGEPDILLGNMISDFVKGKKQFDHAVGVQKGIRLHRYIDTFTDGHPVTIEMKKMFKPVYGLYAGAFTDITYDHFLANDVTYFPNRNSLQAFSTDTYHLLEQQLNSAPIAFQQLFPYMKKYDWLTNYSTDEGIRKSFQGMVNRAKYMNDPAPAFGIFLNNKELLQQYYDAFFPLLKNFAANTLQQLLKGD